jgi:hypothetical protein
VPDALTESDLSRLIKLCGRLGSEHEGERAAAALKVSEFLKSRALGWGDVLVSQEPALPEVTVTVGGYDPGPPRPSPPPAAPDPLPWQMVAQEVLDDYDEVFRGDRERGFVNDLLVRGKVTLSPAQEKWLRDIAARAGLSW